MRPLLFSLLAIMMVSCKKDKARGASITGIQADIYAGTFQRQVSGAGPISNVTITFNSGDWTGQSQYAKYPALCRGTYETTAANQITFENSCPWTAEFDGTLILAGSYDLIINGDSIEISKVYSATFKDIYKLKKQ